MLEDEYTGEETYKVWDFKDSEYDVESMPSNWGPSLMGSNKFPVGNQGPIPGFVSGSVLYKRHYLPFAQMCGLIMNRKVKIKGSKKGVLLHGGTP